MSGFELAYGFPHALRGDAEAVAAALPAPSLRHDRIAAVARIGTEQIPLPSRINADLPALANGSRVQQLIVHCLYSRHHDGFTRQRHLEPLLNADAVWTVPYVLLLVGEYVVEIVRDIELSSALRSSMYTTFVAENVDFCTRLRRRVTSYWNCYYRQQYPNRDHYPGFRVLHALGI